MATKYHISDDGMPGACRAQSVDSCPKTQTGDSFHGTAEEAQAESQRRFVEEFGELPLSSRVSSPSPQSVALTRRAQELRDSVQRFSSPVASKAERRAIEGYWITQGIGGKPSASTKAGAGEPERRDELKRRADELRFSVQRFDAPTTSKAERGAIEDYWADQGIESSATAASLAGAMDPRS